MNQREDQLFEHYKELCGDYSEDWCVGQIVDEVLALEEKITKLTEENSKLNDKIDLLLQEQGYYSM